MTPDPDILIDLTTGATPTEAEIIVLTLRDSGVPAYAGTTAGIWNPWELGSSKPYRVAVRRRDLERAKQVLRETRADSAGSIDWDHLDVGQPEPDEAVGPTPSPRARALRRRVSLAMIVLATVGPGLVFTLLGFWRYSLIALGVFGIAWLALSRAARRSRA